MKCLLLAATFAALGLAACGGGGSAATPALPAIPTVPAVVATAAPTAAPTPIFYTALGDSITAGGEASTIGSTDFVTLVGKALGATTTNLGIGGQFSGPVNVIIPTGLNIVYTGVLAAEVPNIPLNTNLISLYIGTNDLWLTEEMGAVQTPYAANLAGIISGIHARVPNAKIVALTVPNDTYRNAAGESAALKTVLTGFDNAMRTAIIGSGALVADLQCDPAMYNNANFPNPYDVHPNDAGHAAIAADVLAQIAHPTAPAASCVYQTSNI
jgi:lysophospholipase L1-like esterase